MKEAFFSEAMSGELDVTLLSVLHVTQLLDKH